MRAARWTPAALWRRWVVAASAPFDARLLGLVRIAAALCIVVDLGLAGILGLVDDLWTPFEQGGISKIQDRSLWADEYLGEATGPVLYGVSLVGMVSVALGIGGRPVQLLAILAYAQLGHLYPPGDRGVDRILRTALLILLFSRAHQSLSLGRWLRGRPQLTEATAAVPWVLRLFLVDVYLSAGVSKLMTTSAWLEWRPWPVLYRILADPMAGRIDPVLASEVMWLWTLGGFLTVALELSAPLLLTRWAVPWALVGVGLHLGIAATMHLGMFAWGMLSLYPVVLGPWAIRRLRERRERREREAARERPGPEATDDASAAPS